MHQIGFSENSNFKMIYSNNWLNGWGNVVEHEINLNKVNHKKYIEKSIQSKYPFQFSYFFYSILVLSCQLISSYTEQIH